MRARALLSIASFVVAGAFSCGGDDGGNGGQVPPGSIPSLDAGQSADGQGDEQPPAATGRWFGSIHIVADVNPPPPDPPVPGMTRNRRHADTWKTTIRIEEDGKRVTTARWHLFDFSRTVVSGDCYEQTSTTHSDERDTVTQNAADAYLKLSDDGKGGYRSLEGWANLQNTTTVTVHGRETVTTCDGGYSQSASNGTPLPHYALLPLDRIAGTFGKDKRSARGSTTFELNGAKYRMWWSLKRDKEIVAKVGGPYEVTRGDTVTLDGSESRGQIDEYRWTVTPGEACANMGAPLLQATSSIGAQVEKAEKVFSFVALCDLEITLNVKGPAGEDDDDGTVDVERRDWSTEFVPPVKANVALSYMKAGTNRCSVEPNLDEVYSHYIHHEGTFWRNSGYTIKGPIDQSDSPFKGVYYIDSKDLKVSRLEIVNSEYLAGGAVYAHNVSKGNEAFMQRVGQQIAAHEATHSSLMAEWISFAKGTSLDGAYAIESLASTAESTLADNAEGSLAKAEEEICKSTRHPLVWSALQQTFSDSGRVYIPGDIDPATDEPLYRFGNETLPCE